MAGCRTTPEQRWNDGGPGAGRGRKASGAGNSAAATRFGGSVQPPDGGEGFHDEVVVRKGQCSVEAGRIRRRSRRGRFAVAVRGCPLLALVGPWCRESSAPRAALTAPWGGIARSRFARRWCSRVPVGSECSGRLPGVPATCVPGQPRSGRSCSGRSCSEQPRRARSRSTRPCCRGSAGLDVAGARWRGNPMAPWRVERSGTPAAGR